MRGRHVMMGYMHNREETQKTIAGNGFLHSGDLGKVDADGFIYITGRIKELIITAGGCVPSLLSLTYQRQISTIHRCNC